MPELSVREIASLLGLNRFSVLDDKDNVVLETQTNTYRIHTHWLSDPCVTFKKILLSAFADEYQKIGVDWRCYSMKKGEHVLIIEEHENLISSKDAQISQEDARRRASIITRSVESNLGFHHLIAQLKQKFGINQVEYLRIAQDTLVEDLEFAVAGSNVIESDHSRPFLAIVDKSGRWNCNIQADSFMVDTAFGKFVFAPKKVPQGETELALRLLESTTQWWLFPLEVGKDMIDERRTMIEKCKKMHSDNMKILTQNKDFPVMALSLSVEDEMRCCS